MKNFYHWQPHIALWIILFTIYTHTYGFIIIPTTARTARSFPGIIPYATPSNQTTIDIGAYLATKKQRNTPYQFLNMNLQKTFANSLFITGNYLISQPCLPSTIGGEQINLLFGQTKTYYETEQLDFINTAIYLGLNYTTKKEHPWSIPIGLAAELGLFDWLTIGLHETVFFFPTQNDSIQYNTLFYLYADHILRGTCGIIGLSHTYQTASPIRKKWHGLTVHATMAIDLATSSNPCLPTFSIYTDYGLGKRTTQHRLGISCSCIF